MLTRHVLAKCERCGGSRAACRLHQRGHWRYCRAFAAGGRKRAANVLQMATPYSKWGDNLRRYVKARTIVYASSLLIEAQLPVSLKLFEMGLAVLPEHLISRRVPTDHSVLIYD